MKRLSLLLVTLAAASTALATTYVRVEKDGSKTYSDRPLPGGQPVELEPVQTYTAPKTSSGDSNVPAEQRLLQNIDDFMYASCSISPTTDTTFTNPPDVPISVTTDPALRPGDEVSVTVDGKPVSGSDYSNYVYAPADRGSHTIQMTIKDGYGRTLCSASSTIHVFRPSLNMPGRR
jgi:hypothetical protein